MDKFLFPVRTNCRFLWGLLILIILFPFNASSQKRDEVRNYVLLVSFDAFRWDYTQIYNTPNFKKMADEGFKAQRLIPSFPTNTFPNHYTLATGLHPDHHGLINNTFPAPDIGMMYRMSDRAAVENPLFYQGEPVWITAEKQGIITASFYWVGSEAPVMGKHPTYWKKYDESVTYGERIDTVIKWLSLPNDSRPGFITLYFDEPDARSHNAGPVSKETGMIVTKLDSLLGVLRIKLSQLPIASQINLIVLADHGMAQLSPDKYINIRSVAPQRMISELYGSNPFYLITPAKDKADSLLNILNHTRGLKAWKKSEVPSHLKYGTHPRITEIVALADSSWSIGTRENGSSYKGGAHGYDNSNSDMHAIFYAAGPAFKKNVKLSQLENVDVYNIVCRILGIKPSPNDGDPAVAKRIVK